MKKTLCLFLVTLLCTGSLLTGCTAAAPTNSGKSDNMNGKTATALQNPQFPKATKVDDYTEKPEVSEEFLKAVIQFCADSAALAAAQSGPGENLAFSPISLYMALAMTSMGAENATFDEMVRAFHFDGMDKEKIAEETKKLFENIYFDNEAGKSHLANSIWIDDQLDVKEDFYKITAAKFFAPSYNVDLQDRTVQEAISKWVDEQTNGKVTRPIPDDVADVVMSLINTIYFIDQWGSQFDPEKTEDADFTLADGSKVSVPFMKQLLESPTYVKTKDYEAVAMYFRNGYQMNFYLPVGNTSASDLLAKNLILRGEEEQTANTATDGFYQANISLPKFDIKSTLDLTEMIGKLGMGSTLDPMKADFSGISDQNPFISSVVQSAAVTVDEQGCEAAAYTEVSMKTTGIMEDPIVVNFDLNRPFAFTITDPHDVTLFCGVVNNPTR